MASIIKPDSRGSRTCSVAKISSWIWGQPASTIAGSQPSQAEAHGNRTQEEFGVQSDAVQDRQHDLEGAGDQETQHQQRAVKQARQSSRRWSRPCRTRWRKPFFEQVWPPEPLGSTRQLQQRQVQPLPEPAHQASDLTAITPEVGECQGRSCSRWTPRRPPETGNSWEPPNLLYILESEVLGPE